MILTELVGLGNLETLKKNIRAFVAIVFFFQQAEIHHPKKNYLQRILGIFPGLEEDEQDSEEEKEEEEEEEKGEGEVRRIGGEENLSLCSVPWPALLSTQFC